MPTRYAIHRIIVSDEGAKDDDRVYQHDFETEGELAAEIDRVIAEADEAGNPADRPTPGVVVVWIGDERLVYVSTPYYSEPEY